MSIFAVKQLLLLSCLVGFSAGDDGTSGSKPGTVAELLGLRGARGNDIATLASSFLSSFAGLFTEMPTKSIADPPVLVKPFESQVSEGHREAWPAWKDIHDCHVQCGDDEACHKKCPTPWGHKGRGEGMPLWKPWGHKGKGEGHPGRWKMMMEIHACHEKCGLDDVCHNQCPQPWEIMQRKCKEVTTIKECHESCGHDFECHKKCPMPACKHAAEKVQSALACHGQCVAAGSGRDCHRACPKPFRHFEGMCEKVENALPCHQACPRDDRKCHQACWLKGDGDEADGEDHPHHGHRRHHEQHFKDHEDDDDDDDDDGKEDENDNHRDHGGHKFNSERLDDDDDDDDDDPEDDDGDIDDDDDDSMKEGHRHHHHHHHHHPHALSGIWHFAMKTFGGVFGAPHNHHHHHHHPWGKHGEGHGHHGHEWHEHHSEHGHHSNPQEDVPKILKQEPYVHV